MASEKHWIEDRVSDAVTSCRQEWGAGFDLLGPELKRGLIAAKVLTVIGSQHLDGYTPAQLAGVATTLVALANAAPSALDRPRAGSRRR